jgi:hypothetical protein
LGHAPFRRFIRSDLPLPFALRPLAPVSAAEQTCRLVHSSLGRWRAALLLVLLSNARHLIDKHLLQLVFLHEREHLLRLRDRHRHAGPHPAHRSVSSS